MELGIPAVAETATVDLRHPFRSPRVAYLLQIRSVHSTYDIYVCIFFKKMGDTNIHNMIFTFSIELLIYIATHTHTYIYMYVCMIGALFGN